MLCKLSIKNIGKSFKDYAIYFFTLILGVSIFYVFNAIESQTIMMNVTASKKNIIDLMTNMLSGVSVFVSCILGFLIIYASRFLIKRRNKEFGIYLTLGMSKQKMSFLLFFETFLIGIISLVIGLGVGIFLSQWMSILVVNLFEADMSSFHFIFSKSACLKTIIYFGIIYLIVMIFNTVMIGKYKLIDLLNARKKSEKIMVKNSFICLLVFVISISLLGYAYYMVTLGVEKTLDTAEKIFIPILLGIISTYGIFWSISGFLLKILSKAKRIYYKGLNCFTIRQISSKINTTVFSMSVICIMLFVTICVLSSSLSIKNSMTENLKTLTPVDIELIKARNLTEERTKKHYRYTFDMIEDSTLSLEETLEKFEINLEENFKDIVIYSIYRTNEVTIKSTLGEYYKEAKEKYLQMNYDAKEDIITISDYNKIANLFHLEPLSLKEDEYILIADFDSFIPLREEGLKRNTNIKINGKVYTPKYQKCINGFISISSNHINSGVFIVPDNAVDSSLLETETLLANYQKENVEEKIIELENHPYISKTSLEAGTKKQIYESSVGLGALVTFIGLYLGIIFLISSAAILALKELSESTDNKERFQMLRKLGTEEKQIHKALFNQIAIFFLFPLLLAIIHSVFGIIFSNYILSTFGNDGLLPSIIMTSIFLLIIYGGYFLITYFCSKNILKER